MKSDINSTMNNVVDEVKIDKKRRFLSVQDIDEKSTDDINTMFGTWFEADHCDKDR